MPGQSHLLIDRLDRDEAHVALARGRGDRLGIGTIIPGLAALAEGLHELGRDDTRQRPYARQRRAEWCAPLQASIATTVPAGC